MKLILFITRSNFISKKPKYTLSDFVDIPSKDKGWESIYTDEEGERVLLIHNDSQRPEENAWQQLVNEYGPTDEIEEVMIALHFSAFNEEGSKIEDIKDDARGIFSDVDISFETFSRELDHTVWQHLSKFIFARELDTDPGEEILISKDVSISENKSPTDAFDELADAIRKKKRTPEISLLKHRLSHCLLPIVVDLQGWEESGFDEEYGQDIVQEYKDGGAKKHIKDARRILYGSNEEIFIKSITGRVINKEIDHLAREIEKINESYRNSKNIIEKDGSHGVLNDKCNKVVSLLGKWLNIKSILPPAGEVGDIEVVELFGGAMKLVSHLDSGNCGLLEEELTSCPPSRNPFQEWYDELESALGELRDEVLEE